MPTRSLKFWDFKFHSMIYFELTFIKTLSFVSILIFFFACECPVAQAPFVQKSMHSPLNFLAHFVRDHLTICTVGPQITWFHSTLFP